MKSLFILIALLSSNSFAQVTGNEIHKQTAEKNLIDASKLNLDMDQLMNHQLVLVSNLNGIAKELNAKTQALGRLVNSGTATQAQLMQATKQMQETQMSFNLQYLQLQSQMQHENRSYTAISNIMKTKHDTVKNSISNIR